VARAERQLFALSDQILLLDEEIARVADELSYHRSLADDAARDAAVSDAPIEHENATMTARDVEQFRRRHELLIKKRAKLESRRQRLMAKLGLDES